MTACAWDVETARTLWIEGKSAGYISGVVGVSRNAIIGKMNRLGLSRPSPGNPLGFNGRKRGIRKRRLREYKVGGGQTFALPPEPPVPPLARNITLEELTRGDCRFATGFSCGQHLFCGSRQITGSAYCEYHFLISVGSYVKPLKLELEAAA